MSGPLATPKLSFMDPSDFRTMPGPYCRCKPETHQPWVQQASMMNLPSWAHNNGTDRWMEAGLRKSGGTPLSFPSACGCRTERWLLLKRGAVGNTVANFSWPVPGRLRPGRQHFKVPGGWLSPKRGCTEPPVLAVAFDMQIAHL